MTGPFKPPSELSLDGNQQSNWKSWKHKFEIFMAATESDKKSDKIRVSMLLNLIGDRSNEIYETFTWLNDEHKLLYKHVTEKFDAYFAPRSNLTVSRYRFFTLHQVEGQSIDEFITEVKLRSKDCQFAEDTDISNNLIRDKIICGLKDKNLQEKLLRVEKLTLEDTVKHCRTHLEAHHQAKELAVKKKEESVDRVHENRGKGHNNLRNQDSINQDSKPSSSKYRGQQGQVKSNNCKYCGGKHQPRQCPAFHHECKKCRKYGHYENLCFSQQDVVRKAVNEITDENKGFIDDNDNILLDNNMNKPFLVDSIQSDKESDWNFITKINNDVDISFKLDSGADVNLISIDDFGRIKVQPQVLPNNVKLKAYNQTSIPVKGQCNLSLSNAGIEFKVPFIIADFQSIIGGNTCLTMNLIKKVCSVRLDQYSELFGELGCLQKTQTLHVKEEAIPTVHSPRRVPESLKPKLKEELDRMERLEVIQRVEEPTDWVSSLVIVEKPDGNIRVCLDPKDLNKALKRSHYPLPTTDDILNRMRNAKVFSKLDASSGYWQMKLDPESAKLLTFNTPFGRYCFLRVPFGVHSASELFQKEVEEIIMGIDGVASVQDDIIIWGSTQEEHDERLDQVLKKIEESGLKLNRMKCQFSTSAIIFLGHKITDEGISPDPRKTDAITNMPEPTDRKGLQRFLGMINYIGKFIPNLAELTAPLRKLLQKDIEFRFTDEHKKSYNRLKEIATSEPILKSYDIDRKTKISADSSRSGLGGVLLQDHENSFLPVAYASRALTQTESNYAQIEKECLAQVFATTRFHQYVYGQEFVTETDHKPLLTIFNKEISKMPARIQRLMLKLQSYPKMTMIYTPGSKLAIADALSRAYLTEIPDSDLAYSEDIEYQVHMVMKNLPITNTKLEEFRQETEADPVLKKLRTYINDGWPENHTECDTDLKPFWTIQKDLTEEDWIIFRSDRVVVPSAMRSNMKEKIHEGHMGIVKCQERARSVFYWPNMNSEIQRMVASCGTCQEHRNKQPREPNIKVEANYPWQILGSDIYHLDGQHYLIVVDYFSGYPEVHWLGRGSDYPTATSIIDKFKRIMSDEGVPEKLITDGGPQYTSGEFASFAKEWEFACQHSSPEHPRGNPKAERTVQTMKNMIKKCHQEGKNYWAALLAYRSTPGANSKYSPAEILKGRTLRTGLTSHKQSVMVPVEERMKGRDYEDK